MDQPATCVCGAEFFVPADRNNGESLCLHCDLVQILSATLHAFGELPAE